jgi:Xaa-Pro aminopeptidase
MNKYILCFLLFLINSTAFGQILNLAPNTTSKGEPSSFYTGNRKVIRDSLPENSMAIFFSAPVKIRSNDVDYNYHQDPSFYYLTGINEPNSILLIFKNPFEFSGKQSDEILFVPVANDNEKRWTGSITSFEEAKGISGISNVYSSCDFASMNYDSATFSKVFYITLPAGMQKKKNETCDLYKLVESFKEKVFYPPSNGDSYMLGKILRRIREVKNPQEVLSMKKAISISVDGHIEMMKTLKPGLTEYQVQAIGECVFKMEGAEDLGYPSICGGGENSCVLHYSKNRSTLKDGDLLLLDMGAEYQGYSADVTRTLPVNGKFNNEQKIIYELVLKAQKAALAECKPGNNFNDPHDAAVRVIQEGLLSLGIINDKKDYTNYFMHGTSHYLGLDVHDVGTYGKLKPGNVITVEPGIYISSKSSCDRKWWNIGIRIEDDVLITDSGFENLSAGCPSEIIDVERMMKEESEIFKSIK